MSKQSPNILIIVSDQQNIDTISAYKKYFRDSAYGPHWLKTPNFDRLVDSGVSFLESHATNPVCSPSRSSIFTGRYASETGVNYNNIGIDKNVPNMGEWLSRNTDYDCYYCGKWHAGGKWSYPSVDGPQKIPGFKTIPVGGLGAGDIADYNVSSATKSFLSNYTGDKPFLLVSGLLNPHDICFWAFRNNPLVPKNDQFNLGEDLPDLPPNNEYDFKEAVISAKKKYSKIEWQNYIHDYFRMIERLDEHLGRILDALDQRDDETMVIFTSDHGEGRGMHSRVQKGYMFEEGVKVPLIISWPEKFRKGVIDNEHFVSGVDLMSTVCEVIGIQPPPNARGISLKSVCEGKKCDHPRNYIYTEAHETGRMIRTHRYKYIMYYKASPLDREEDKLFVRKKDGEPSAFIQGKGHLFEEHEEKLLFDMKNDPWEMNNLSEDPEYSEVLKDHEAMLREMEALLIPGIHFDRNEER